MDKEYFLENLSKAQEKQKIEEKNIDGFDKVNSILFNELERLNNISPTDDVKAKVEIARGMAISNVSMTLLKSISLQTQQNKNRYILPSK